MVTARVLELTWLTENVVSRRSRHGFSSSPAAAEGSAPVCHLVPATAYECVLSLTVTCCCINNSVNFPN